MHANVWITHCHNVINDKIEEYTKMNVKNDLEVDVVDANEEDRELTNKNITS